MARTILVIDDEPDIRDYLIAVLEDRGFKAVSADAGQTLTRVVTQTPPDLILLDIMMPYRSGIAVYKTLRSTAGWELVPIVMISGMSFDRDFAQSVAATPALRPPDGFIDKPINIEALMATIDRLLG